MRNLMKLTKNEKLALKFLIKNGRIPDADIARKLKISTQAVGKIRRKMEKLGLIKGYASVLDYGMLGINTFALAVLKLTMKSWEDLGEIGIERQILNSPNLINVYRIPEGSATHIGLYGFQNLEEMDRYFHIIQTSSTYNQYIEIQKIYIFSNHSLIKESPSQLFNLALEDMGKERQSSQQLAFAEIQKFKEKLKK
jgi:DNA-binding Lrp family transcriptional regulator